MSQDQQHNWNNYWQGRTQGEALAGVGIEQNPLLAEFWRHTLKAFDNTARIVDMACGAGSVLRHVDTLGFSNLTGVDISVAAIETLATECPAVKGVVAPVTKTGLETAAYDLVVSQYGFEYAGNLKDKKDACVEMARLIRPGGQIVAICHYKGGGIEKEVDSHLQKLDLIEKIKFTQSAKKVFVKAEALEKNPSESTRLAYQKAVGHLGRPRERLVAFIQNGLKKTGEGLPDRITGLAQHLLAGTGELFERRAHYSLSDILGWIEGMEQEIAAYRGRMASMKTAALDAADARMLLQVLEAAGGAIAPLKAFYLAGDDRPAAWILRAKR